MDFDKNAPIWLQVMEELSAQIVSGKLRPNEKLPGVRELAMSFSINPNTAARVYQEMEKAGICETRRGLGTFVTDDQLMIGRLREESARRAAQAYVSTMKELGFGGEDIIRILTEVESNA